MDRYMMHKNTMHSTGSGITTAPPHHHANELSSTMAAAAAPSTTTTNHAISPSTVVRRRSGGGTTTTGDGINHRRRHHLANSTTMDTTVPTTTTTTSRDHITNTSDDDQDDDDHHHLSLPFATTTPTSSPDSSPDSSPESFIMLLPHHSFPAFTTTNTTTPASPTTSSPSPITATTDTTTNNMADTLTAMAADSYHTATNTIDVVSLLDRTTNTTVIITDAYASTGHMQPVGSYPIIPSSFFSDDYAPSPPDLSSPSSLPSSSHSLSCYSSSVSFSSTNSSSPSNTSDTATLFNVVSHSGDQNADSCPSDPPSSFLTQTETTEIAHTTNHDTLCGSSTGDTSRSTTSDSSTSSGTGTSFDTIPSTTNGDTCCVVTNTSCPSHIHSTVSCTNGSQDVLCEGCTKEVPAMINSDHTEVYNERLKELQEFVWQFLESGKWERVGRETTLACRRIIKEAGKIGICRYPWTILKVSLAARWEEVSEKMLSNSTWRVQKYGLRFSEMQDFISLQIREFTKPPCTFARMCELLDDDPPYCNVEKFTNAFRKTVSLRGTETAQEEYPSYLDMTSIDEISQILRDRHEKHRLKEADPLEVLWTGIPFESFLPPPASHLALNSSCTTSTTAAAASNLYTPATVTSSTAPSGRSSNDGRNDVDIGTSGNPLMNCSTRNTTNTGGSTTTNDSTNYLSTDNIPRSPTSTTNSTVHTIATAHISASTVNSVSTVTNPPIVASFSTTSSPLHRGKRRAAGLPLRPRRLRKLRLADEDEDDEEQEMKEAESNKEGQQEASQIEIKNDFRVVHSNGNSEDNSSIDINSAGCSGSRSGRNNNRSPKRRRLSEKGLEEINNNGAENEEEHEEVVHFEVFSERSNNTPILKHSVEQSDLNTTTVEGMSEDKRVLQNEDFGSNNKNRTISTTTSNKEGPCDDYRNSNTGSKFLASGGNGATASGGDQSTNTIPSSSNHTTSISSTYYDMDSFMWDHYTSNRSNNSNDRFYEHSSDNGHSMNGTAPILIGDRSIDRGTGDATTMDSSTDSSINKSSTSIQTSSICGGGNENAVEDSITPFTDLTHNEGSEVACALNNTMAT